MYLTNDMLSEMTFFIKMILPHHPDYIGIPCNDKNWDCRKLVLSFEFLVSLWEPFKIN